MSSLMVLPNEVLFQVAENLPTPSLNILSQTSKWFNELLSCDLHKRSATDEYEEEKHPLVWAVKNERISTLKRLLPHHKKLVTTVVLRIAVELGNEEALDMLLNGGADPYYQGTLTYEESLPENKLRQMPLLNASKLGNLNMVKRISGLWPHLLKSSENTDQEAITNDHSKLLLCAFKCALCEGHLNVAEYFYNETRLIIPPSAGPMLFRHALVHPHVGGLEFLYAKRHEINGSVSLWPGSNSRLLERCILSHYHEYINCMWTDGPILHAVALQQIHTPRKENPYPSAAVANMLLDWGADIEAQGPNNSKLLHIVARVGDPSIAECLLERGADVDVLDQYGRSALIYAVECKSESMTRVLLKYGADMGLRDPNAQTPLHIATELQEPKLMRLLIEAKADINAVDNTGHTPLHIAAMLPGIEATLILLANGAAVNVADLYGRTPLFFARQVGNTQVVRLLEEHQDFVAQQAWRYCGCVIA